MNILVIGSSIAGPATAWWLARYGFDVTVIERAPALREGGYCVDVRGSALTVIERMGLREALHRFESDTIANAFVDEHGRTFGRTARGFGVIDQGDLEIPRGDLSRVFFAASRDRVDYRFGTTINALVEDGAGVAVTFDDGTSRRFDAVIGADGVHSRTRALAFGPASSFVRPMGACMAVYSAPNDLGLDREQWMLMSPGRVVSMKTDNGNETVTVSLIFRADTTTFDPRDIASQRCMVADAFADLGWEYPRLIAAGERASDFYADITCQIRMDAIARGRVALVGDAGYCASPMSGQGTSLALVGAYVLATELARDRDVVAALARYDATMRPFAARNQDVALDIARGFAPDSSFEVRMRRLFLRMMPFLPGSQLVMKLAMRGIRDAARSVTLPPVAA